MHLAVDHRGQAGVGQARQRHAGGGAEVAEVLVHLRRPGGAVDAEDVGAHGVEGGEGGGDLGAGQHATGELHGHLDLEGDGAAGGGHGPPAGDDGRLGLEQVEDRLDQQQVDAAGQQPPGLDLVGVAQLGEADVAERRELGAGADGAGDPAGTVGGREVGGHGAGEAGCGLVELLGPVGDPVLAQWDGEGAEGVGLDHVATHLEERRVQFGHHVGPGGDEDLVAAFERRAPEVVGPELPELEVGAATSVEHDHPLTCGTEEIHGRKGTDRPCAGGEPGRTTAGGVPPHR